MRASTTPTATTTHRAIRRAGERGAVLVAGAAACAEAASAAGGRAPSPLAVAPGLPEDVGVARASFASLALSAGIAAPRKFRDRVSFRLLVSFNVEPLSISSGRDEIEPAVETMGPVPWDLPSRRDPK